MAPGFGKRDSRRLRSGICTDEFLVILEFFTHFDTSPFQAVSGVCGPQYIEEAEEAGRLWQHSQLALNAAINAERFHEAADLQMRVPLRTLHVGCAC